MDDSTQPPPGPAPASAAMVDRTSDSSTSNKPGVGYQPPEGEWKDGLFACSNQIAPSCVIATCIPCLGVALVAQRIGWSGGRQPCGPGVCTCPCSPTAHYKCVMFRFLCLLVAAAVLVAFTIPTPISLDPSDWRVYNRVIWIVLVLLLPSVIFVEGLIVRTRQRLRLPPLCGGGGQVDPSNRSDGTARPRGSCLDGYVALLCFPCVLARLLRHLFDFKGVCDTRWPLRPEDAETLV